MIYTAVGEGIQTTYFEIGCKFTSYYARRSNGSTSLEALLSLEV